MPEKTGAEKISKFFVHCRGRIAANSGDSVRVREAEGDFTETTSIRGRALLPVKPCLFLTFSLKKKESEWITRKRGAVDERLLANIFVLAGIFTMQEPGY